MSALSEKSQANVLAYLQRQVAGVAYNRHGAGGDHVAHAVAEETWNRNGWQHPAAAAPAAAAPAAAAPAEAPEWKQAITALTGQMAELQSSVAAIGRVADSANLKAYQKQSAPAAAPAAAAPAPAAAPTGSNPQRQPFFEDLLYDGAFRCSVCRIGKQGKPYLHFEKMTNKGKQQFNLGSKVAAEFLHMLPVIQQQLSAIAMAANAAPVELQSAPIQQAPNNAKALAAYGVSFS